MHMLFRKPAKALPACSGPSAAGDGAFFRTLNELRAFSLRV